MRKCGNGHSLSLEKLLLKQQEDTQICMAEVVRDNAGKINLTQTMTGLNTKPSNLYLIWFEKENKWKIFSTHFVPFCPFVNNQKIKQRISMSYYKSQFMSEAQSPLTGRETDQDFNFIHYAARLSLPTQYQFYMGNNGCSPRSDTFL